MHYDSAPVPTRANKNPDVVFPILWQPENYTKVVAAGTGETIFDIAVFPAGSPAPYSGHVYKKTSCDALRLFIDYIAYNDVCGNQNCVKPSYGSTQNFQIDVPAGMGSIELPRGYISKITGVVINEARAASPSVGGNEFSFISSRPMLCPADEVLVPA